MYRFPPFRAAAATLILLALCAFFVARRGEGARPEPTQTPQAPPGAMERVWQENHFVLVTIKDAAPSFDEKEHEHNIAFGVRVVYDNKGTLQGKEIHVTGPEYGANAMGAGSWQMPDLTIGDTAIFRLTPTQQANVFDASPGGGVTLPIGLATGVGVEPQKVEQARDALTRAGDYFALKDRKKVHEDAVMLLKSKQYYLWALGVSLLSLEGTQEDAQRLEAGFGEDRCTPDMALWLDDQLLAISGWDKKRANYLQSYLWLHSSRRFGPPP